MNASLADRLLRQPDGFEGLLELQYTHAEACGLHQDNDGPQCTGGQGDSYAPVFHSSPEQLIGLVVQLIVGRSFSFVVGRTRSRAVIALTEVEWLTLATLIEGTRYYGHDGVRQWIGDVKRDWARP